MIEGGFGPVWKEDHMTTIRRLLPASGIRAVFDRAKEIERSGKPVLHLEIGMRNWN